MELLPYGGALPLLMVLPRGGLVRAPTAEPSPPRRLTRERMRRLTGERMRRLTRERMRRLTGENAADAAD